MWKEVVIGGIVCAVSALLYFVNELIRKRKQLEGLPQPPMPNLLFGHLYTADECMKLFPKSVHSHAWPDYIREKWKMPENFYVDWRPFGPLWLFMADPELLNEYVMTKQCIPKSPLEKDYLDRFLGSNNLVSLEGQHWKMLRSMFNPGFSASNIMTYTGSIVEASLRFAQVLREKAQSNEHFELEEYATRLTIDIIGIAVFDVDMQAQDRLHPIVLYFRERVLLMPGAEAVFPWQGISLTRPFRLWWNNRKLEQAIGAELDSKILRRAKDLEAESGGKSVRTQKRSIIDLALNAYEKEILMGQSITRDEIVRITDPAKIPSSLRKDIVDSIKTFFFAGHDTTSSTICYCFYLLHRFPEKRKKLDAELDALFPLGTSAADAIRNDPYIINKLEYTTAVIKETLRIFPPASGLRTLDSRWPVPVTSFKHPDTNQTFFLEGVTIWPVVHMLNRNRRFFPEPTRFIPERFIPSQTPFPEAELFTPAGKSAFQPFHVGPRNCIGQELAMNETKVILALTAREFDFILEYPGEEPDPQPPIPESTAAEFAEGTAYGKAIRDRSIKPNIVEGHRPWQTLHGSAKPIGHCPGRVRLRTSKS